MLPSKAPFKRSAIRLYDDYLFVALVTILFNNIFPLDDELPNWVSSSPFMNEGITSKLSTQVVSTIQAAEILAVTPRQVQRLIAEGHLPAIKLGRDYVIAVKDLSLVEKGKRPLRGRPKKG